MQRLEHPADIVGPAVVTVGNFDGVHRGHQVLIARALQIARQLSQPMIVLTFDPHPAIVLRGHGDHFLLTPGESKMQFLEEAGSLAVRVMPFTREFAQIPARVFLDEVLARDLKASHVVVGYNFTFGHKGAGDVALLRTWGEERDIAIDIVEPWRDAESGKAVSSSWIRQLVMEGHMEMAQKFLGHPFRVCGRVAEGDHRGRQLGAPTLNIVWPEAQVTPPYGVYAGMAHLDMTAEPVLAVANFGVRPTFGGTDPRLEIFLLDVEMDKGALYGHGVQFDVLHWIRPERQFDNAEALSAQIRLDVEEARRLLQSHRASSEK